MFLMGKEISLNFMMISAELPRPLLLYYEEGYPAE